MQANWGKSIALVLQWEGPEVNISNTEPGGISKYGVSLQTYADYCKVNNLPVPTFDDIKNMTSDQASAFYKAYFADDFGFDDLPSGVDYRILDISVNLGKDGTKKLVSAVTGNWDAPSAATILKYVTATTDQKTLINNLGAAWIAIKSTSAHWYIANSTPTNPSFGHGWQNRRLAADQAALAMLEG